MGETSAQSGHSRSSNSMIATFAPLGGLNAEVSLNAVAPVDGIAVCAPAGTTETRANIRTKRFIVPPILVAKPLLLAVVSLVVIRLSGCHPRRGSAFPSR